MNRKFDTSGDFMVGNVKQELEVEIEYDPEDPRLATVVEASIVIKPDPMNNSTPWFWFMADQNAIDEINNSNGALIGELADQHAADVADEIRTMEKFERDIRADIIRGCR